MSRPRISLAYRHLSVKCSYIPLLGGRGAFYEAAKRAGKRGAVEGGVLALELKVTLHAD